MNTLEEYDKMSWPERHALPLKERQRLLDESIRRSSRELSQLCRELALCDGAYFFQEFGLVQNILETVAGHIGTLQYRYDAKVHPLPNEEP